jgi:hypothetical protein
MSLKDCIQRAQTAGHLTVDEANELQQRLDTLTRQILSPPLVRQQLIKEMEAIALQKRRVKGLQNTANLRNEADVLNYRGPGDSGPPPPGKNPPPSDPGAAFFHMHSHQGQASFMDVEHKARAIDAAAKTEMEDMLHEFRRGALSGDLRRTQQTVKPRIDNMVRELFGENTGDTMAAQFAKAFSTVAEKLRIRFNDAGGAIGKLKNWGLPQIHDQIALRAAGKQAWIDFIFPRIDLNQMRHPLTGLSMSEADLRASLDHIYDTIITEGWNTRDPSGSPQGRGALFKQHADHRFLAFKNADVWMEYQRQFGQADAFATMLGHIHVMARDIAAMEVFGPNPTAGREYLKGVVLKATANDAKAHRSIHRADQVWDYLRGTSSTPVSMRAANVMADIRNTITGVSLGSAVFSSLGDLATQSLRRHFNGLPSTRMMGEIVSYLAQPENRRLAVRAGLDLDQANNVIAQQARYVGSLGGSTWSRYIADRVITLSGLSPWTQAGKHVFGRAIQGHLADQVGKSLDQIDAPTRNMLLRHGIDAAAWDLIRQAALDEPRPGATYLIPAEIAKLPGGRDLSEKYISMIMRETTYAIPEATPASQTLITGSTQPGTWAGEILRSGMQFKGFPVAFLTLHGGHIMRQLWDPRTRLAGATYAGALLIGMSLLGAVAIQLKEITSGRDPRKMTPNDALGAKFWLAAMQQGGGLGIFGDFLFSDVNRFGGSVAGTLGGPLAGRFEDLVKLSIGNARELGEVKLNTNFGRELVSFLKNSTPGQSLWFARLAWERLFFDQLQYLADPQAHVAMQRRMQHRRTEFGQEYYWRPGETSPRSGPDFSRIGG